jgi:hypothetical protein
MNLDTLVRIGQPPWHPVPAAEDVDVWDKYDFPTCGTYRLGDHLVIFTLITTAMNRSLWAYVPVPPDASKAIAGARFDTESEFNAFLEGCFAGREAVFAAAQNFVITAKSDGILILPTKHGLLEAGARWYIERAIATGGLARPALGGGRLLAPTLPAEASDDDGELLRVTQGILASAPA